MLSLDQPLPGLPVDIFGVNGDSQLVTALDNGRLTRYPTADFPTLGIQVINRRNGEYLAGTVVGQIDDQMLLATAAGFGRRLTIQSRTTASASS